MIRSSEGLGRGCDPRPIKRGNGHRAVELLLPVQMQFHRHLLKRRQINGLWYNQDTSIVRQGLLSSPCSGLDLSNGQCWRLSRAFPRRPPGTRPAPPSPPVPSTANWWDSDLTEPRRRHPRWSLNPPARPRPAVSLTSPTGSWKRTRTVGLASRPSVFPLMPPSKRPALPRPLMGGCKTNKSSQGSG